MREHREKRHTHRCDGVAARDECPDCGGSHWRWQGCGQASCEQEGCQAHHTNRRAKRAWSRLQAFEGVPWGIVVLTIPGEVRETLREKWAHGEVRKRAVAVVLEWARRWGFHGVDVKLGGLVVAHPCGENPDIWAPHYNVIFPWVGETADGAYRRGRYHIPKHEAQRAFDDLRQRWSVELVELGWSPTCSPQVDYEWRRSDQQKRHSCRYFLRSFPKWQSWTHRVFWWGILAGKIEGHEPPPYSEPLRPGRCVICGGNRIQTLEHVSRGKWHRREFFGPWIHETGPPPGKWAAVWAGTG